jgi:hypothetical protein
VLVVGFVGLVPTWFLLKLFIAKAPRALLVIVLAAAALGPVSWLAVRHMAAGLNPPNMPVPVSQLLGLFIAFVGIPRMVFGPVLVVIEAATFFLVRERVTRALLVLAMLMDLVPLGLFALHMMRATRY